ncbi:alpha/beta fold hydrolase [Deinococcus aquiradiocola]|uniref:Alpha/beta hydrolase n=1 Tax=Deinococcus aquiradiocola TaxID=393059 RepID=A0A917PEN5_9DEIO|nr:alpha/beta hydrolase [Deinococcus aquiradiocola]GGJ73277.1 alpha/beta hydrolase [Deinococcus aquiradiocola]
MTPALHTVRSGPPDAPAVLLLHGGGLSSWSWQEQRPALHGWQTLTPDLPGHGLSPGPFSLAGAAAHLAALLEHTGPARVIGLSVGSQLALTLLAQRPDLIHSALLSGTLALPTRLGAWLSGPPNDLLTRLTWPAHTGPTTLTLQRLAMNLPARHAHHLARDARTVTRQTHLDLTRENLTYRPDPGLARTTVPVTLLVGSREHDILHRSARHLTQLLPLARAYRVPHMTHLWPLTHPQHYNAVLHAWLHGQPLPDALQPL